MNATGDLIIDLADLFGITEEGHDGWISVWVNAGGGFGFSDTGSSFFSTAVSVSSFSPSDPDPTRTVNTEFLGISSSFGDLSLSTTAEHNGDGNGGLQFGYSKNFGANWIVTLAEATFNVLRFEVNSGPLNNLLNAFLGGGREGDSLAELSQSLFNEFINAYGNIGETLSTRALTKGDDGSAGYDGAISTYSGGVDLNGDGTGDFVFDTTETSDLYNPAWENFTIQIENTAAANIGTDADYILRFVGGTDGWKAEAQDNIAIVGIELPTFF
jgi:hypothetical protein